MITEVISVEQAAPLDRQIRRAAEAIRDGKLVAFPTETVYGLGANALDSAAVERIFEAKGRPAANPIIVHVLNAQAATAEALVSEWPSAAERLAAAFWPGPLTLVLPRGLAIPDIVTAGGPTVGIRVPAHPVALALLREAAVPIAAPSANRSTEVSPTRAAHVVKSLGGRIEMVLDGGPTTGGIESTVLDVTGRIPRILRPGLITANQLRDVIGALEESTRDDSSVGGHGTGVLTTEIVESPPSRSPGQMRRHYAPKARIELVEGSGSRRALELAAGGAHVGWMPLERPELPSETEGGIEVCIMQPDPAFYAPKLYESLHAMDEAGVGAVVIQIPPDSDEWAGVRDRLRRAAASD